MAPNRYNSTKQFLFSFFTDAPSVTRLEPHPDQAGWCMLRIFHPSLWHLAISEIGPWPTFSQLRTGYSKVLETCPKSPVNLLELQTEYAQQELLHVTETNWQQLHVRLANNEVLACFEGLSVEDILGLNLPDTFLVGADTPCVPKSILYTWIVLLFAPLLLPIQWWQIPLLLTTLCGIYRVATRDVKLLFPLVYANLTHQTLPVQIDLSPVNWFLTSSIVGLLLIEVCIFLSIHTYDSYLRIHQLFSALRASPLATPSTISPASTPDSSDSDYTAEQLGEKPRMKCPICLKPDVNAKYHRCQTKPSLLEIAKEGDLAIKTQLMLWARSCVVPNRTTVVCSFLNSAKAQVTLARYLGCRLPTHASGNPISTHGLSTIVEAKYQEDETFRQQYLYYMQQELLQYKDLTSEEIPSPCRKFIHPSLRDLPLPTSK